MEAATLSGGFANPAVQSATIFRSVMEAVGRPGTLQTAKGITPPAPLSPAAGAILLTLCETETPIYLAGDADTADIRAWIAFHTGAPMTGPSHAMFAVGAWDALAPLSAYRVGETQYPDRSATLIVETPNLTAEGATLTGPGIKDTAQLSLPEEEAFHANSALFPLGLDFIFTCGETLAALPRTTQVNATEVR